MPSAYRTLLCATDLSPVSRAAVELAYSLAAPGAVVHLLHVAEPLVLASPLDGTILSVSNDPAEALAKEKRATAQMLRLVPEAAARSGIRTETSVIQDAGVTEQILAAAKKAHADVIVMGTHGRSGFGRLLLGSVATDVLRKASLPVILIHDRRAT
jgi:nucleotide-binding universal stress UspA family protein